VRKEHFVLLFVLFVFFSLTQFIIFEVEREAWFDVSFSLQTANNINDGIISSIGDFRFYDVHPPFFYYVLAGWQLIGPDWISPYQWAQELSVIAGLLFLVFLFVGLRTLFGVKGVYALIPFSLATTYLHFATEVRMYMFVLLFSAILFAAFAKKFRGNWLYVAIGVVLLLPNFHYLSIMVVPVILWMHLVINCDEDNKWVAFWLLVLASCAGVLVALNFAFPQRLRTEGTWFQSPSISSWSSALFYAFWMGDVFAVELSSFGVFVFKSFKLFCVLLLGFVVGFLVARCRQALSNRTKLLLMMGSTAVVPILALAFFEIGKSITNGGAFWNLYHHRFFLVLTWMFVVVVFILLQDFGDLIIKQFKRVGFKRTGYYINIIGSVLLLFVFIMMLQGYVLGVHYELKRTIEATPCESAWIGHESPFSAITYKLYGEEHGCEWFHFISTRITEKMSHSAGFDAIPSVPVYWNGVVPEFSFYYVMSDERSIDISGRDVVVVYVDDGISLVRVFANATVEVVFI